MAKRIAAGILMCAVMVLVAAAPVIGDTHPVIKGDQGPHASAVTWEYVPTDYGNWTGHIVNNNLRSLVVNVYDNTTGVLDLVFHQRIRFAAYDARPTGEVNTSSVTMSPSHRYEITVIPNGPKGSSCTVEDMYKAAKPPVAIFTATVDHMDVTVNASASYDPYNGTIVSYDWTFGDGVGVASGVMAAYTYSALGTYWITLTLTDDDGMTGSTSQPVEIVDNKPVASFTMTKNGLTVYVDASESSDDFGIVDFAWVWGDDMSDSGVAITKHTYATKGMYTITLVVTDTLGQTGEALATFEVANLPVAAFTYTTSGQMVDVDASGSSAEAGIVSYTWNWGDGSPLEVLAAPTASHTYGGGLPGASSVATTSIGRARLPPPPYTVFGFLYLSDGVTPAAGADVTVIDTRSGVVVTTVSEASGYYAANINPEGNVYAAGDPVQVAAVLGALSGTTSGVADDGQGPLGPNLWLDVTLRMTYTVTLTVTDTLGQMSSVSHVIV